MFAVLLKAFSFIFIVFFGIFLRSRGIVADNAGDTVKKLLINLTLPAAIIINFSNIQSAGGEMIVMALLGIAVNVVMIAVGAALTRKRPGTEQALYMLCLPAYNIGAFCLPFVQNFLPAVGSVAACMFDVGNSVMCTGGTYAFVAEYTAEERKGMDIAAFAKRLITSPPLVTYVVMFVLSVGQIHLPKPLLDFLSPMAEANTFVAMMMLGLLFHLELKREYLREVLKILGIRHVFAAVFAVIFYLFLPLSLILRQTLVLLCFAPVSAIAPAYTGMCGGDEGMASCINSLSILCSLFVTTVLIAVMGLRV